MITRFVSGHWEGGHVVNVFHTGNHEAAIFDSCSLQDQDLAAGAKSILSWQGERVGCTAGWRISSGHSNHWVLNEEGRKLLRRWNTGIHIYDVGLGLDAR